MFWILMLCGCGLEIILVFYKSGLMGQCSVLLESGTPIHM